MALSLGQRFMRWLKFEVMGWEPITVEERRLLGRRTYPTPTIRATAPAPHGLPGPSLAQQLRPMRLPTFALRWQKWTAAENSRSLLVPVELDPIAEQPATLRVDPDNGKVLVVSNDRAALVAQVSPPEAIHLPLERLGLTEGKRYNLEEIRAAATFPRVVFSYEIMDPAAYVSIGIVATRSNPSGTDLRVNRNSGIVYSHIGEDRIRLYGRTAVHPDASQMEREARAMFDMEGLEAAHGWRVPERALMELTMVFYPLSAPVSRSAEMAEPAVHSF